MAAVKFTRKNNHPCIEVVGLSGSEKAFITEFFDTFANSRYKANHVFLSDSAGKASFGFKSFLNTDFLREKKYDSCDSDMLRPRRQYLYDEYLKEYLFDNGIKDYFNQNFYFRESDGGLKWYGIIVTNSLMSAYVVGFEEKDKGVFEIIRCELHNNVDVFKLIELEKSIGL